MLDGTLMYQPWSIPVEDNFAPMSFKLVRQLSGL